MRPLGFLAVSALLAVGHAPPAVAQAVPAACVADKHGKVDNRACADAAAPDSRERSVALSNLGLLALQRRDYAAAVRFYDEAEPSGGQRFDWPTATRVRRALAYDHVGREQAAAAEAHIAATKLLASTPQGRRTTPAERAEAAVSWAAVLPIMKRAGDPDFAAARAAYDALPADDWMSLDNRATVLLQLGDMDGAVKASDQAVKAAPVYGVLNNACYIMAKAGRPEAALHYCYRAVQMSPGSSIAHDSWAVALAALGRCPEAEAQRAQARKIDPSSAEYLKPLECAAK